MLAAKFIAFHRLDQLREASGFLESAIERELLGLAKQFRDDAKELSESEQSALAQQVIDRSGIVEETLAQGLRHYIPWDEVVDHFKPWVSSSHEKWLAETGEVLLVRR